MLDKYKITPGHFKLHEAVLVNYAGKRIDISKIIDEFTVTEGITSLFSLYEFTIVDAVNLIEKYIITGNEKIELTLIKVDEYDGNPVQKTKHLIVLGIGAYARPSNEGQAYKLKAISEESFAASSKRISQSVNGNLTDILNTLYGHIKNKLALNVLDGSIEGNYKAVLPNKTYIDTFKMLLSRAQKSNGSMFFMYETLWNDIQLNSYDTMISSEPVNKYELRSENSSDSAHNKKSYDDNKIRIKSIDSKLGSSQYKNVKNGAYNSIIKEVDISTKKYTKVEYNAFSESVPKMDKEYTGTSALTISGKSMGDYINPVEFFINENTMAFEGADNLNNKIADSIAKQNTIRQNAFAVSHTVTLHGDSNLSVGKTIEIKVPPALDPGTVSEHEDALMSGKYVVYNIVHKFNRKGIYDVVLTVRKDSINRSLIEGRYDNLGG